MAALAAVSFVSCAATNRPATETLEAAGDVRSTNVESVVVNATTSAANGSMDRADVDDPLDLAVRYVASVDALVAHSSIGRRELLARFVIAERVEAQLNAIDETIERLDTILTAPAVELVWVEAPLTVRVTSINGDGATVEVWTVSVFAHPDGATVEQIWRTLTVSLATSDGRWWVTDAMSQAGPTPSPNELALPSPVDEFVGVAGWEPVTPVEQL